MSTCLALVIIGSINRLAKACAFEAIAATLQMNERLANDDENEGHNMKGMSRRGFMTAAGGAFAAMALTGCSQGSQVGGSSAEPTTQAAVLSTT